MPRDRDSRSRSPHRHRRARHDHRKEDNSSSNNNSNSNRVLPFTANPLTKHDRDKYLPLFALYLDVQKQLDIEDLDTVEVKGRWKSFVKRWNHGDLAEGWYDPNVLRRAVADYQEGYEAGGAGQKVDNTREKDGNNNDDDDDDEEEFGPPLPTAIHDQGRRLLPLGATEPSVDELRARREDAADEARSAQEQQRAAERAERKAEKKLTKERLEDLAPRAEPGSRERQVEKKREANLANRAFAQAAHEAGDVELRDSDIMGGDGGDSLSELKRMKQQQERKKNERELRREEILRARRAEREEKGRRLREKEEKTIEYLRSLAKERFG